MYLWREGMEGGGKNGGETCVGQVRNIESSNTYRQTAYTSIL